MKKHISKMKIIGSIIALAMVVLVFSQVVSGSPFSFNFLNWFFEQDLPGNEMTRQDAYGSNLLTGMEVVVRVGDKFEGENREKGWMDGQIVDIRPLGFYTGRFVRQHFAVIELPNINYWDLRGSKDWKSTDNLTKELDKYLSVTDAQGDQAWDDDYNEEEQGRIRDYFIDFHWLLEQGHITEKQYFDIYDRDKTHQQISLDIIEIERLFSHEDTTTRLAKLEDRRTWTLVKNTINRYVPIAKALVSSGTYSIGAGLDYDTVTLFEADIAAQLTGNLTGEHADEETSISSTVTFDTDTNTYLLKLTAADGAEHDGGAYGSGARINFTADSSWCGFSLDETTDGDLDDIEISKLAFDISGQYSYGILVLNGGNNGLITIDRCLIKSGADNNGYALEQYYKAKNVRLTNNIVYGHSGSDGVAPYGIYIYNYTGCTICVCNNTCVGNYNNFREGRNDGSGTLTFKNNLAQSNAGGVDYFTGNYGTHSNNISEDATSPDVAYQSKEVSFVDEANDDYHLSSIDNQAKDAGADLSGTFTDDIDGQVRGGGGAWDIGADERAGTTLRSSTAKPVYGVEVDTTHPLADGLVGAWIMNEGSGLLSTNLIDSNLNFTLDASTEWVSQGIYSPSDTTTGASVADGSTYDFAGDFSVATSFKYATEADIFDATKGLVTKGDLAGGTCPYGIGASWDGDSYLSIKMRGNYSNISAMDSVDTNHADVLNKQIHIVATYDNTSKGMGFYRDGLLRGINTYHGAAHSDTGDLKILNGKATLYYLYLYNRALSASEIAQLYSEPYAMFRNKTKINTSQENVLTDGLVGYWSFDGPDMDWSAASAEAIDTSGQGNDGDVINGAIPAIGISGQALEFDGVDDYIDMGDIYNGVKTIAFWLKANDITSRKIIDIDGTDQIEIDGSSDIQATSFPTATVYVDGAVASTITSDWHFITITDTTGVNSSAMDIGRVSSGYFDGLIDEVRIYNKALSEDEIGELYQAGTRRATIRE